MVQELSDKAILQLFLSNFHVRQTSRLKNIPKVLLDKDWSHARHIFISLLSRKLRNVTSEQYAQEIVRPFTDEIIHRIDNETDGCDLLLFHTLPLPKYCSGSVISLDGVTARIVTETVFPDSVTRIDIAFTPMFLQKTGNDRLWFVGRG